MKAEVKKLPKSQIEITFEITADEFKEHTEHALEHLKAHVKVDGFRPGNVPLKIVEEKVGQETLLMEAGDHAVKHVYYDYIAQNKLEVIGEPEVSIVKIAKGSEFVFKAKITVLPEVELPDYKGVAGKVKGKDIEVTEKEMQESINYLQKTRAKFSQQDKKAELNDFVDIEYSAPEINEGKVIKDRFTLGEGGMIKSLKESVKGGITAEKTEEEKQRKRGEILEKIAEKTKVELPEKLVEYEKERLFEDLKNNIASSFKISFEEYMASVKKTEQEIKDTFKIQAEKRLKSFLVLKEIGKVENVKVDGKELEEEMKKAMAMYNKEQLAKIDTEQLKEYTEGVVFNEKVFQILENFSK